MNLYLLTQDESRGYDTYDSCVVAADSDVLARVMNPGFRGWDSTSRWPEWATSPINVKVEFLAAGYEGEAGFICCSFNAG